MNIVKLDRQFEDIDSAKTEVAQALMLTHYTQEELKIKRRLKAYRDNNTICVEVSEVQAQLLRRRCFPFPIAEV